MAEAAKNMAVIGEEASFSGQFKGHDLVVLGRFEGQIEIGGRLRVGPKGHAKANVRANAVEVEGEIEGDVRCESISLLPTARALRKAAGEPSAWFGTRVGVRPLSPIGRRRMARATYQRVLYALATGGCGRVRRAPAAAGGPRLSGRPLSSAAGGLAAPRIAALHVLGQPGPRAEEQAPVAHHP